MNFTRHKFYKPGLLALALLLFAGAGQLQHSLNRERVQIGLAPLPNDPAMPPMLALTTQALGGFRGLIANALWIRASQLQEEDKYFEMVQLADWITKLEPHFVQVWLVQSWNMTYNISVKFSDPADRWRWVLRGIELLRDDGLRYNPDEALIYRELAWFFQHKMGQNLDEAQHYYKGEWAREMTAALGSGHPKFDDLINPQSAEAKIRAAHLLEKYKMDARKMKTLDDRYGPLDWRLPEAHAIYWASLGLEKSKPDQLITLRRVIYQSMQMAFQRGRLVLNPDPRVPPRLGPNLEIVGKANAAYEEMIEQDAEKRDAIKKAHRNFLREACYVLYVNGRNAEGQRWLKYVREKYPDAVPADVTLTDYVIARVTEDTDSGNSARVTSLIQGFIIQSYLRLIEDEDGMSAEYALRARELWEAYGQRIKFNVRLMPPPLAEMKPEVLKQLLDEKSGLSPEARDLLRKKLGLPVPAPVPPKP